MVATPTTRMRQRRLAMVFMALCLMEAVFVVFISAADGSCTVGMDGNCATAEEDEGGEQRQRQTKKQQDTSGFGNTGDPWKDWAPLNPVDFLQEHVYNAPPVTQEMEDGKIAPIAEDPFASLSGRAETTTSNKGMELMDRVWQFLSEPPPLLEQLGLKPQEDDNDRKEDSSWQDLIFDVASLREQGLPDQPLEQVLRNFGKYFDNIKAQLDRSFQGIGLDRFDLLQIWYKLLHEEAQRNPVWKRRQHRFLPPVSSEQAISLSDGLFLSALAYASACSDIETELKQFHDNAWVLVNCTTTGMPSQPAHFMAIRRQSEPLKPKGFKFPWQKKAVQTSLEVALVIRGTKEVTDMMSDALLEPSPYRGGLAHDGIRQSAEWLHQLYLPFLTNMLESSKRDKLSLWIVGHSLGGGTAALASIEFNHYQKELDEKAAASIETSDKKQHLGRIEAHALGFGSPAVVSLNLSESVKDSVKTIINDADCVPRMSSATLAQAWLRVIQYNWTEDALQDLDSIIPVLRESLPMGHAIVDQATETHIRGMLIEFLKRNIQPANQFRTALQQELFPPGDCIHLYRDGVTWAGNFMPCRRFNDIEIVRHLVDDHLLDTGYYHGILGLIRRLKQDVNWRYQNDIMELPVWG